MEFDYKKEKRFQRLKICTAALHIKEQSSDLYFYDEKGVACFVSSLLKPMWMSANILEDCIFMGRDTASLIFQVRVGGEYPGVIEIKLKRDYIAEVYQDGERRKLELKIIETAYEEMVGEDLYIFATWAKRKINNDKNFDDFLGHERQLLSALYRKEKEDWKKK